MDKTTKTTKCTKTTKPRYKLLTGNGVHTAVGEFIGVLLPPQVDKPRELLLTNGTVIEAKFIGKNNNKKFINKCLGRHLFRGYPVVKENKLIAITITAVDPKERIFPKVGTDKKCLELWLFRGLWTPQKTLNIQRSLANKDVKKIAKEKGFIKKYKYQFKNSREWSSKLWDNYVYEIYAYRDKDNNFNIFRTSAFCCPIRKPVKN